MNKYFVIYSGNPYLLARLCTELQMEGERVEKSWCDTYNPFGGEKYMLIGSRLGIQFHSHNCSDMEPIRLHLLEKNYQWVLTQILETNPKANTP